MDVNHPKRRKDKDNPYTQQNGTIFKFFFTRIKTYVIMASKSETFRKRKEKSICLW